MATREQLLRQPRSGARPLTGPDTPRAERTRQPRGTTGPGRGPAGPQTPRVSPARAGGRPRRPATYQETVTRERQRRQQQDYRGRAREQVARERGERGLGWQLGQARQYAGQARGQLPGKTWHRVILAEFVACVVIVGFTPLLTPATRGKGDRQVVDTSVSLAAPLVRLTALSLVFFVLALMSSGPRAGKVAAAFGGLITLGVLVNATGETRALSRALGPAKKPGPSSTPTPTPVPG